MLVNFTLEEAPMGSLLRGWSGERQFRCAVAGTERLQSVELIRNNEIVATVTPGGMTFTGTIDDSEPLDGLLLEPAREMTHPFAFYYLRVTQVDGHQAWTSPIWTTS